MQQRGIFPGPKRSVPPWTLMACRVADLSRKDQHTIWGIWNCTQFREITKGLWPFVWRGSSNICINCSPPTCSPSQTSKPRGPVAEVTVAFGPGQGLGGRGWLAGWQNVEAFWLTWVPWIQSRTWCRQREQCYLCYLKTWTIYHFPVCFH